MGEWVKVPYVFTYKARHFFNESLLDGSKKSVVILVCVL